MSIFLDALMGKKQPQKETTKKTHRYVELAEPNYGRVVTLRLTDEGKNIMYANDQLKAYARAQEKHGAKIQVGESSVTMTFNDPAWAEAVRKTWS